jgi:uncharacterized protein
MATALRKDEPVSVDAIIRELEAAKGRPDAALTRAVDYADEIAPAVMELVEKAADDVYLIPKQANLLLWGIHVLATARYTELYRPLLRLIRERDEDYLDRLLGDVTTETLPRLVLSVFDGDPGPLLEACADCHVEGATRWSLMSALARLTFDGAVPRTLTLDFMDRFERESLAEPGDLAWAGWEDSIILLGLSGMRERVHATWKDGRNPQRKVDQRSWDEELAVACAMTPGDPGMFVKHRFVPIDDPVEALNWTASAEEIAAREERFEDGPFGPDPAAVIALNPDELDWLMGFFYSQHVRQLGMSMEMVDGLFCALIAGPGIVRPNEGISAIWEVSENQGDDAGPVYDSAEQAEYATNLLRRHWNTIAIRLDRNYPHVPVLEDVPDIPQGFAWAIGFVRVVSKRIDDWAPRSHEPLFAGFIVALAGLAGRKEIIKGKLSPKERAEIVGILPLAVRTIFNAWRQRHDPFARPAPPAPSAYKVGRNEPCPCGSGKKYKRCCGSREKLQFN